MEVKLVKENIIFDESDVINMDYFDVKSPIFYKEKEEIPEFRIVFLGIFILIIFVIIYDTLDVIRKSNKYSFEDKIKDIMNNHLVTGTILLFITYLFSPF